MIIPFLISKKKILKIDTSEKINKFSPYPMNIQSILIQVLFNTIKSSAVEGEDNHNKAIDLFKKSELFLIPYTFYQKIRETVYFDRRIEDLMKVIASYQGRDESDYNGCNYLNLHDWIYYTFFYLESSIDNIIKEKVKKSEIIDKLIKKRFTSFRIEDPSIPSYDTTEFLIKFSHTFNNDGILQRLRVFFMKRLAEFLVSKFGQTKIDDKVFNWKGDIESRSLMSEIITIYINELNDYSRTEDFALLWERMLNFFIHFYKKLSEE